MIRKVIEQECLKSSCVVFIVTEEIVRRIDKDPGVFVERERQIGTRPIDTGGSADIQRVVRQGYCRTGIAGPDEIADVQRASTDRQRTAC